MRIAFIPVSLLLILLLIFFITVPTLIGIYVYRDARRRSMNATLWALLSAFAPGFVGLIIYLVVRSEHTDLCCRNCGKPVRESFAVCPHCGTSLKEHCTNCNEVLETGWANCPHCGTAVSEEQKDRMNIPQKRDSGLGKLLAVLILVPIILFFSLTVLTSSVVAARNTPFSSDSTTLPTVESAVEEYPFLEKWISDCDAKGKGTYVLPYEGELPGEHAYRYFVYRNDGRGIKDTSIEDTGLFSTKKELRVTFDSTVLFPVWDYTGEEPVQCDYSVSVFNFTGKQFDGIRLFEENGSEINYK